MDYSCKTCMNEEKNVFFTVVKNVYLHKIKE